MFKFAATPYELIDHFTDFLLVSLNDETLLPLMHSYGLLDDHDVELITTGPTSYQRNNHILSCVQHMDITGLMIFSKVLQESHPHINLPLTECKLVNCCLLILYDTCLYLALHSTGFSLLRSFKAPHIALPDLPQPSTTDNPVQGKQDLNLQLKSRKRPLAEQQSSSSKQFKPSMVNKEFLQLTNHLNELVQFCDPKMIAEHCSSLMASDVHGIAVFPAEYIIKLQNYNHTPSLLRILSSFWNWSNYSILRVLLKSNNEALKLLDEYASQSDQHQQLASYPLALPSSCMIPSDGSTHTVLAVKCAQEYYQCLLKHVFEVQSQLMRTCDLTPHSFQLLAAKSSSTILYWLIPKSVVALISTKVLEYSSLLYSKGILEVSIFPAIRITTKALNLVGSLAYLSTAPLEKKVIKTNYAAA